MCFECTPKYENCLNQTVYVGRVRFTITYCKIKESGLKSMAQLVGT